MKKIILYTILHILLGYPIKAQTFEWAKAGSTAGASKMVRDKAGNFYVVGGSFLCKYDSTGNFIWQQNITGTDYAIAGIVVDTFSNLYATGSFGGTINIGSYTLTSTAGGDANTFLVKYNSAGIIQWVKRSISNRDSGAGSITIDNFGNPIIIGKFLDSLHLDSFFLDAPETNQVFLAKYSPSGVCLWAKHLESGSFGGGGYSSLKIKTDKSGNSYISGHFSNHATFDNITINAHGEYDQDVFLAKFDLNGTFLWAQSLGGSWEEESGPMDVDSIGNTYISGYFSSSPAYFGSYTLTANSESYFTAKYDTNGNCLWAKNGLANVICASNDGYYTNTSYNNNTGFMSKFNKSGTLQWTKNVSGASNSAMVSDDTNVYITGSYKGSVNFDTCILSSANNQMFIAKLGKFPITTNIQDTVTNRYASILPYQPGNAITIKYPDTTHALTNIQQTENTNCFSVFPNPTGNSITVCVQNTNNTDAFTLSVTNSFSQIVYTEEIKDISSLLNTNGFTKQIDLSLLPKGIYFVELQPAVFGSSHNTTKRNITKIILQ